MSRTNVPEVRAALDAVLNRLKVMHPDAAGRAARALDAVLAATRVSIWPEVAWRWSGLTNTGFPVEFSWSSLDSAVRWTAEAAGPESGESQRLDAALRALERLGIAADVPGWLTPSPDRTLRFGAWLGGRHDASGDRYKLYIDLAGIHELEGLQADLLRRIPSRIVWRMAGVDPKAGVSELYGRLLRPKIWEIERLLAGCELDADPVLAMAGRLTGRAPDGLVLTGAAGISLAFGEGRVVAAGCFIQSGSRLGGDPSVARRVYRVAAEHGWSTKVYDAVLGQVTSSRPGRHGMIGFGVSAGGDPWLQVGLRP